MKLIRNMLTEKIISTNKGRLYWVYVVVRQDNSIGRHFETVRMFFDEQEATNYCNELKIHPRYGKFWNYSINKTKVVI